MLNSVQIYILVITTLVGACADFISFLTFRRKTILEAREKNVPVDKEKIQWKLEDFAIKVVMAFLTGLVAAIQLPGVTATPH